MITAGFVCVLIQIAFSHGSLHYDNNDFKSEDNPILSSNSNGQGISSDVQIIDLFDPNKNIIAHKNIIDGVCILELKDGQAEILNFKNKYDKSLELSSDEMNEIIGENIRNFCKDKVIIFSNNFDNDRPNRSKRSVEKKRYQGQTQTQFVSFGSKNVSHETKNGLAEALSQPDLSRATVSGLNGMGQAQSQSSFGDCDECYGQDYQTHPTHGGNSQSGNFPLFQSRNQPDIQYGRSNIEPSINRQYPNTYPNSGIDDKIPGKQDQGYGIRPVSQQIPNMYPVSGTNTLTPGKQDQGYGIEPLAGGQYSGLGTSNITPGKQDQGYGTGLSANQQYPNTYSDFVTNNLSPSKQDQGPYNPVVGGKYPNTFPGAGVNNKVPDSQDQGGKNSNNFQYPNIHSNLGNNKFPGNLDQGFGYNFSNEKIPNIANTYSPESKKPGSSNVYDQNTYAVNSNPFNPNSWNNPYKLSNSQQTYPGGSSFPSIPSGSSQGILGPHNIPNQNVERIYPTNSPQVPIPTYIEQQSIPIKYPSSEVTKYPYQNTHSGQDFSQLNLPSLCNFLYQTCLNALSNNKKPNEGYGIQSTYGQPPGKLYARESSAQQPSYTSSSGNVNPNQIQPSYGYPQGTFGTGGSGFQQPSYTSSGGNVNPNQIQPSYGYPQGTFGTGGSGVQQPGYTSTSGNVNPNQIQPQSTFGTGGSDVQQPGYTSSGGNVNPNQIQPQSTFGTEGSVVQQPDYTLSGGNLNPNQIQPQSTFGTGGSGVQQPGYTLSGGNLNPNQIQPRYGYPQGTFGTGGSGFQQPSYTSSGGNVNPNQIQPSYGYPQGTFGTGGSGVQQPGYTSTSGNANPNQIQPQSTFGGSGVQQPGYTLSGGNLNPNQIQPQSTFGTGGSSVQQPGYTSSSRNVNPNQIQPQSTFGTERSGVQQPGYTSSGGNVNPNQIQPQSTFGTGGSGVQQPGYTSSGGNVNPNQIQPQSTFGTGGSGVQQPGYTSSGGNLNPNQIQPNYGYPQGTFVTGGSGGVQPSSSRNGNPNQIQTGYGQPQNAFGSNTQPGYGQTGDQVNQNNPLNIQSTSDGKIIPGNYPLPYGNNYYRGQQLGPGSPTGNNYPSPNPIIGGQFGTDISSGSFVIPVDTEGGDAQSMTNVNVDGQDTSASASAQGKSKTGMTQTQVSGSYSGTGMFSAQAQTSDSDKGAQSQIISNTNGTTSTAQGKGGKGQSQSQVVYNSESGIALGEAQSSGINYGTNTQLQAGIKGGLADAQSSGPGSTSSQAQIGFLPYESNNSTYQKSIFKGGGTASSQGGSYNGQSQSQLFGSYKHGISYNGAAQASSGKKLQNLPKLNLVDAKLKIGQLKESNNAEKNQSHRSSPQQSIPNALQYLTPYENTSIKNEVQNTIKQNISSTQMPTSVSPQESSRNFDIDSSSEYEDNDEYTDEKDETINTKSAQTIQETNPKQEQNIFLNLGDKHDAQITRDSDSQLKTGQVLDSGQIIPGTNGSKIPDGFRGRVASVAGDHTEAKAIPGGQAQTQTVILTPGAGGLTVVDKTKFRALLSKESYVGPLRPYNGFQTDMNGETGKFKPNDNKVQYFTKSSTCGYFSFSCNYVNGGKSGAKICKPNPPPFPCQKSN
ncbi:Hypothetical protein CINCED_3A024835 [Cinara cedri]|uniref:Uncharacterized protein n=1 Tax=Cinara cedri TaxID=506608 RepID=A0A5E4M042_9HEMI|nr:Hypothetical protein CINCED_3A024835 [Cinara cedri]